MGRGLMATGAGLLALTVALWVAEAAGWLAAGSTDRVSTLSWKVGASLLAIGLVLRLLTPVQRRIRAGRCIHCGSPVLPGHLYCTVHLQDSVNAWRDQARERTVNGAKRRR